MPKIPRDRSLDSSVALLAEGYQFIAERARRLGTDIFETRLLGERAICLVGEGAAKLFYDESRFYRADVAPKRMQNSLLGTGGVQGLDGPAHRYRKHMFMSLMSRERIQELAETTAHKWRATALGWPAQRRVVLLHEAELVLCRAVCEWAGVPLLKGEATRRAAEFHAMIDGAGAVGLRHWRARRARKSAEQWIANAIGKVRREDRFVPEETALHTIAHHRDSAGQLLPSDIAAVELINVLRPTVAIATFVTFAALALHQHPESRRFVTSGDARELEWFVQEVRRFYPFFPFVVARVRRDFEWRGYPFPAGRRVLLDLYGTDHDDRLWEAPSAFRPERFRDWTGNPFSFIPQGGGRHDEHHRCAGERLTIELMKVSVQFLVNALSYRVPEQDLSVSLRRVPALPKSRFVLADVELKANDAGVWAS